MEATWRRLEKKVGKWWAKIDVCLVALLGYSLVVIGMVVGCYFALWLADNWTSTLAKVSGVIMSFFGGTIGGFLWYILLGFWGGYIDQEDEDQYKIDNE